MAVAEDRLRFEKLLADLSATFVNLPSERLDEEIDSSLKTLVEFLGNDRSTLVKLVKDKKHVLVTHSYAVPGCEPFPLGSLADDRLPWFIGQFRGGNTVFLRRLPEDLPPEANTEKRYCQKHGITSNVTIPLKAGGSVLAQSHLLSCSGSVIGRQRSLPVSIPSGRSLPTPFSISRPTRRSVPHWLRTRSSASASNKRISICESRSS